MNLLIHWFFHSSFNVLKACWKFQHTLKICWNCHDVTKLWWQRTIQKGKKIGFRHLKRQCICTIKTFKNSKKIALIVCIFSSSAGKSYSNLDELHIATDRIVPSLRNQWFLCGRQPRIVWSKQVSLGARHTNRQYLVATRHLSGGYT